MPTQRIIHDANTLQDAIVFAVEKHRTEKRKGDDRPYIIHVLGVLTLLYDVKQSMNMYMIATAAVLHDVVENCGVTIPEIMQRFGPFVAGLVSELTIDEELCRAMGKKHYMLKRMKEMSSYALVIKLCDRYNNISDLHLTTQEFRRGYLKQTKFIMDRLPDERKLSTTHEELVYKINKKLAKYSKKDKGEDKGAAEGKGKVNKVRIPIPV